MRNSIVKWFSTMNKQKVLTILGTTASAVTLVVELLKEDTTASEVDRYLNELVKEGKIILVNKDGEIQNA